MAGFFGRYTAIIIIIVIFLVSVLSVLGLNFYSSYQTEATAESVNIAGRQRMLSQRTAKSLSNLNSNYAKQSKFSNDLEELRQASALFERSLSAFTNGGSTKSTKPGDTILEQVTGPAGIAILDQANALWNPFYTDLSQMIDLFESDRNAPLRAALLEKNVAYAGANINSLLSLMNDLTNYAEGIAKNAANRSRLIQSVGIILSLVCFGIILSLIFGQLRRADQRASVARRETNQIFETVDQGLFLIDQDFNMGAQQSRELERIFSTSSLVGKNFKDFIAGMVSNTDLDKVQRYIKLLFDPHKKQRLLSDLNPLNRLSVQIEEAGELHSKYLRFSFSRVINDGEIDGVLTSVSDISTEVKLESDLAEETSRNEQQLQMISTLLSADAEMLPGFIESSDKTYSKINQILRSPSRNSSDFKFKADSVLTQIHSVKGESAALGLNLIADTCNNIETRIDELKNKAKIGGEDFLTLTIMLDRLISTNDQIKSVLSVLSSPSQRAADKRPRVGDAEKLFALGKEMASRQDKQIQMGISGFDSSDLTLDIRKDLLSLSSQLIRNAISHGIEPTVKRKAVGKSSGGNVNLALFRQADGGFTLSCEDDGNGIDFDTLTNKAIEQGLVKADLRQNISHQQLINLMFQHRLSSRDIVDMDSGRGAGLNVIGLITKRLGAKFSLQTRPGLGTKFIIRIPKLAVAKPTLVVSNA